MNNGRESVSQRLWPIIEEHRQEIEQRWLARIQRDVLKTRGVELTQLRDGIPDYLIGLVKALKDDRLPGSLSERAEVAWSTVAKHHGITRVRIGFDISQLVHEFVILRRVISEVVLEHDDGCPAVDTALADLLDSGISVAVQAYVDARDFEARRTQAANIGFLIHELRQPLSTAMVTSSLVRTSAVTEQLPALDRLDRTLRRIAELIDSVLLTEKLETGEVTLQPKEITLGELMEPVESLREAAERKGLRFQTAYDPALTVILDATLTRSVIRNLVENAVKYTDQGAVDVSVTATRDEVVLNVSDTCQGLSSEELQTIFEPFKRGRTNKSGTGLGLAIVRRAVEAQRGHIHAESPGPFGCRFTVTLPRCIGRAY